jgi:hypothetical protein
MSIFRRFIWIFVWDILIGRASFLFMIAVSSAVTAAALSFFGMFGIIALPLSVIAYYAFSVRRRLRGVKDRMEGKFYDV